MEQRAICYAKILLAIREEKFISDAPGIAEHIGEDLERVSLYMGDLKRAGLINGAEGFISGVGRGKRLFTDSWLTAKGEEFLLNLRQ